MNSIVIYENTLTFLPFHWMDEEINFQFFNQSDEGMGSNSQIREELKHSPVF